MNRQRAILVACTIGYTVFVVYGSLVPLHFRAQPLADAIEAFGNIRYWNLGIASRSDWVANILLFVPLAFGWLGTLWTYGLGMRIFASAAVLLACVLASIGLEFTQLFFPPRTVSLNDIVAESLGAAAGVACWWAFGARFLRWASRFTELRGREAVCGYFLTLYLGLLFAYSLLPLDLTLSPVEIYHKWRDGRLRLLPFQGWESLLGARFVYELASDIVVWLLPAALWVAVGKRSAGYVFLRILAIAALLEFLQLFVYTRVSDVTDVLTAAMGAWAGASLAAGVFRHGRIGAPRGQPGRGGAVLLFGAASGWIVVLMFVFWYPFDFRTDWGFVNARLGSLQRVPFEALYYGSEFRAVTEVFHKTGFFFPLGVVFAMIARRLLSARAVWARVLIHAAIAGCLASVAGMIEVGQLFLPARLADLTDWGLELLGGSAGYAVTLFVLSRLGREIAGRPTH